MPNRADEIKQDIEELNLFLNQAKRQKTKDVIGLEVRKLQTELTNIIDASKNTDTPITKPTEAKSGPKCYEVKLTNYAWDESDKFMKLYVTLNNVQTLPAEAVKCEFTARSMDLRVMGLENRNYQLPISYLCEEIDPSKSSIKVKTDMIVVFLAKKQPGKTWSHVTGIEKRITEAKNTPDLGDKSDPEASLMNLMKKMYQEGDDDMKRTIAKAWTEGQDKRMSSMPSIPNL